MTKKRITFNVVRQVPSSYRVENGQILKYMAVISDIRNKINRDTPMGQVALNDVTHVITPSDITRGDIDFTIGTPTEEDRVQELKFEVEDEIINIYETKHHIILVTNIVKKVFLTNKVDVQNNPILQCETLAGMNTIPKPTLEQLDANSSGNQLN